MFLWNARCLYRGSQKLRLSKYQIARLDEIGFVWRVREDSRLVQTPNIVAAFTTQVYSANKFLHV